MRKGRRDYVGSRLGKVFKAIRDGVFGDLSLVGSMLYNLENGNDHYIVCHDFYPYIEAQEKVDATYRNQKQWCKMAIEGIAYSGKFSSDRTIQEYCSDIWKIEPVSIPKPTTNASARVKSFANLVIAHQEHSKEATQVHTQKEKKKITTNIEDEEEWDGK
jgi:hypothetical protein